ncbi:16S rRNA (guanine(527)-N(7))-methyltransferase RsmG [bacterium]|nr:16S rRNA (guanine(527)-N(7))-methyltransferase RsmG [bacterium]
MEKIININSDFEEYKKAFLKENAKHNLISKNDEKYLYEKHIYDSLGIKLFFDKYDINNAEILDIGCGGGFPCIPIAIEYKDFKITGIDSIQKKINSVRHISEKLGLKNLNFLCDRVENLKNKKFDIVISRAVADMSKISNYALPLVKKNGYFIAYKSKKALEELEKAKPILKKYNAKVLEIIEYKLPLDDVYQRNLICVQKF